MMQGAFLYANLQQDVHFLDAVSLPEYTDADFERKNDEEKLNLLLQKAEALQYENSALAINYAEAALDLSQKTKKIFWQGQSYFWLSSIKLNENVYTHNLELLLSNAEIAAQIFEELGEDIWLIRCWELMAAILDFQSNQHQQGDIRKKELAQKYIQKAITLYEQLGELKEGDKSLLGHLFNTEASIFYMSQPELSMIIWNKAAAIFEEHKDATGLARVSLNKGLFAKDSLKVHYFEKAINIYEETNNKNALKRTYLRYGSFCVNQYRNTKDEKWWEEGVVNLNKGLTLLGDQNICDALNRLGDAYVARGDVNVAHDFFKKAIVQSKLEGNAYCLGVYLGSKMIVCEIMDTCDSLFQDVAKAYEGVLGDREDVVVEALKEKEKFVKQIQAKADQEQRNQLVLIGACGLLGLLSFFFWFYQRQLIQSFKSKMETKEAQMEKQEAQIQALGARMNPHFISNTLNAIDSMIYTNNKAEASKYLVQFAKLSRLVLANTEKTLIPLKKEIETLSYYLSLEKMRFEDELSFELNIDEKLDLEQIFVPPMLIQPFVENAVLHGVQPKETVGKIAITFQSNKEDQLVCVVEDDGIGRVKSKLLQQNSSVDRKSYSMKITEDRIRLIGNTKGATFDVEDMYDDNGNPDGTKVFIILPKNLK